MSQPLEGRPSAPLGPERPGVGNQRSSGAADNDNPFQPVSKKSAAGGGPRERSDNSPSEKTLIEESDGED